MQQLWRVAGGVYYSTKKWGGQLPPLQMDSKMNKKNKNKIILKNRQKPGSSSGIDGFHFSSSSDSFMIRRLDKSLFFFWATVLYEFWRKNEVFEFNLQLISLYRFNFPEFSGEFWALARKFSLTDCWLKSLKYLARNIWQVNEKLSLLLYYFHSLIFFLRDHYSPFGL